MSSERDRAEARDHRRGREDAAPALTPGKYTNTELLETGGGPSPPVPGKRSGTETLPEAPAIQRKAKPPGAQATHEMDYGQLATRGVRAIPFAGRGGGNPLPEPVRARMEATFDVDFSAVRIHEGAEAGAVAAHAFTQGTDIHFAPGMYDPNSAQGLELLGHELAHVVQQAQGRVGETTQANGTAINDDAGLEREADNLGARAARGDSATTGGGSLQAGSRAVQRKLNVNPVASSRHDKVALIGDGTPANQGLSVADLDAYVTRQADWFTEPSLAQPDRDAVWKVLLLLREGPHMLVALGALRASAIAALPPGDLTKLKKYARCFDSAAETVQVSTAATTMARALQLGQAIIDLEAFVPTPVLRVVIPESGLVYLVDNTKIPELKKYYAQFKPTLEAQEEWQHIETLLNEGVSKYSALVGWITDLHIFTQATRQRLVANVADKTRSRPVMLVLFSASDWNTAFLQAANMEAAILNSKNLALVVQGTVSLAAATAEVNRVADDYGQQTKTWDWWKWEYVYSPGRLGQVVMAGHGSNQSVEMSSPGTNPTAVNDNRQVSYDENSINSGDPKANGTELLIDTVLSRMDPKDANVVFAGCLVGSHNIPPGTDVSGSTADAQKNLQAALAANPNLADYVRERMKAKGVTGTVQAANGSTTFSSFNVDASGHAQLSNPDDPDIGGTKLQYVRTGIEPEGALRAALECYADAAIGPAKVTTEIRARVAGLAANTGWWETITRTGFELCLPPAPADVDVAKLLDVVHRIEAWFFGGWAEMIDVQRMADKVKPAEAAKVFGAMLTSSWATADHLKVGVPLAWMKHDAAQAGPFMTALTASSLKRETFQPLAARGILDPKLATLLPVGGVPTKGQLILALTIAVKDGAGMPVAVRDFLRAAAGGSTTSSFPAALGVGPIIAPTGELSVLENIGLAPKSAPPPSSGGAPVTVDGNVDANHNNKNETFITVSPHEAVVSVARLNVRRMASTASAIIDVVTSGDTVRVMGETESGWSFIDHNGKTGFVFTKFVT